VRSDIIPATIGDVVGFHARVTGQGAFETDMLENQTPLVFAFVLTLAFRSLVVPLQLLSVGANWGIMVMVFPSGVLRGFFGFHASRVIEPWIPILLFCILFGLSMDYHVSILSRLREHDDITHDNRESVAVGVQSTGKIITGAALIMGVVFGAFATGSMLALQQLEFGLAVAVLLDATIVRSVLVPSVMTLLADRNWWCRHGLRGCPISASRASRRLPLDAQHSPAAGD
jgi:uncharacterized membrane protein YdfJ with MMPL/SSD domain